MARPFIWFGSEESGVDDLAHFFGLCRKCGWVKTLDQFAKDKHRSLGRRTICMVCRQDYDRERDYIRRSLQYGFLPIVVSFTSQQLVERYGGRCFHCRIGAFECIDHLICVRAGGSHTLRNVVPCCTRCNVRKRWAWDEVVIKGLRRSEMAA